MKSLCILGRQPALGLAELESLYGAVHIRPIEGAALLDIEAADINFQRLGGTIKVAKILTIQATTKWPQLFKFLYKSMPAHLDYLPDGTFNLGVSIYGLDVDLREFNRNLLQLKKLIKTKHPVRIVPNKTPELNSAQVLHNKLTHRGGWELIFIRDGQQTILAQTMFVQDIEAYGARDQARPKRDARVGMLPPKLAQIIINLVNPPAGSTILDPFCGTGVVLQEALLDGLSVYGTDIEPRMIEYSKSNLEWLANQSQRQLGNARLEVGDATNHHWQQPFDGLASETYLGRPFTTAPSEGILKQNTADVNLIIKKFLNNLKSQTPKDLRLCLAVPAWKSKGRPIHLPLLDHLTEMGYNRIALKHVGFDELIYAREGQFVARQLVILERS